MTTEQGYVFTRLSDSDLFGDTPVTVHSSTATIDDAPYHLLENAVVPDSEWEVFLDWVYCTIAEWAVERYDCAEATYRDGITITGYYHKQP